MVSNKSSIPVLITTRNLGYTKNITKIPEYRSVSHSDYILLPCADQYSLIVLYENPFELLNIIYGIMDLHHKVLLHIKKKRKYYLKVSKSYLSSKKLDLVHWIANMMTKNLPVDELCLHAMCTYMKLHITVDYLDRIWTTLDIPNIQHDVAMLLSDIHLAYRGFCKYGLLCKNVHLQTIGKQLMDYKLNKVRIPG